MVGNAHIPPLESVPCPKVFPRSNIRLTDRIVLAALVFVVTRIS
jgi:hypothetical protein